MPHNQHPNAIIHRFAEPFVFETPYQGKAETIPLLEVGYEAWGNPKHPCILVTHALSMNTHCTDLAHPEDDNKSWWCAMVGPGKPVDTNRFYVVCVNMLGGCAGTSGPASSNPDSGVPYGLHFPIVTVADMVHTQYKLLNALGVKRLHAVIGGSMGGFQALTWPIEYPDFVERAIIVASSGFSNQFMIMTNRVQIDAIQRDPNYRDGRYYGGPGPDAGVSIARMIGFTTFISPIMMEKKFNKYHRSAREVFIDGQFHQQYMHEAENYLRRVADPFPHDFDANSMIYLLQTWSHFDLAVKYGSLAKAVEPIRANMMVVSATGDNLFPTYLSEDLAVALQAAGKPMRHERIEEEYGHDFFLIADIIRAKIAPQVREFLDR